MVLSQANLLVIDNALLAQISQKAMGAALENSDDGEESSFSLTAFLLSLWLSGTGLSQGTKIQLTHLMLAAATPVYVNEYLISPFTCTAISRWM